MGQTEKQTNRYFIGSLIEDVIQETFLEMTTSTLMSKNILD